jgi:hypothetical protein
VNDVVTDMSNDKAPCAEFDLYPSFVAGIVREAQENKSCVLSNKKLKYSEYMEKCISGKKCNIYFKWYEEKYFMLSLVEETVHLTFETRILLGELWLTVAYMKQCVDRDLNCG